LPIVEEEDTIVPPSLEEDPNQSSPLPPDVENASTADSLDEFIKQAEEMHKQSEHEDSQIEIPVIQSQPAEL